MKVDLKIKDEFKTYFKKLESVVPAQHAGKLKNVLRKHLNEKLDAQKRKVKIYSPYILSEEEKRGLFSKLLFLKKYDNIENIVDNNIGAGVVVKFGSKVLDLTLEGKLKKLQKNLYELS